MKNIIPFKKDIMFKTSLDEVTSISLEHTLSIKNDTISGDFIVSGEYKISENSNTVEPFEYKIPFDISIDEKYNTDKAIVDIDDFYYEIVNDNILSINIDVLLDHLTEKSIIEELTDVTPVRTVIDTEEERCIEEEVEEEAEEVVVEDKINSIFSNVSNDDVYVTYNIFIVREGDTLDTIMEKYNITEEELKKYNDLDNIKLGDKLIIPNTYERN